MNQKQSIPGGMTRVNGYAPGPKRLNDSRDSGKRHYHTYMAETNGDNMQESLTKMEVRPGGEGVLILTCHGDLSWEDREQLSACVERHFADTPEVNGVIMDLSRVEHVNSAGLGALFQLTRLLRDRGGVLVLVNASDRLARVFRTIGLDRLARSSESVQNAAETLAARGDTDEIRLLPENDRPPADQRYGPGENRRGSRRTRDNHSPLDKGVDRC